MANSKDDRSNSLSAIEKDMSRITESSASAFAQVLQDLAQNDLERNPDLTKNILTVLQQIIESVNTLNRRVNSYRSAEFLAHVSRIHPKSATVVFAGDGYLGDNIKYAYLAFQVIAKLENIECTFIPQTNQQYQQLVAAQLPCLPPLFEDYKATDVELLLRAKCLVLDNHFIPSNWQNQTIGALLSGAKTLQIWHGIPLKQIGLETAASKKINDPIKSEFLASCGTFDIFVGPNKASRLDWERKFSFRSFLALGYPRNDVYFREIGPTDLINVDTQAFAETQALSARGRPIILYAPTNRDHSGASWFMNAAISEIADHCAALGFHLYVNLHPAEQHAVEELRQLYPQIKFIAPHTDINPIVKYVSILITDYSSLAFDFLHLDRPIIFYRPDHEHYVTYSRPLIKNHEHYICGEMTDNYQELNGAIERAAGYFLNTEIDPHHGARVTLRQKLFDHHDGLAASRVSDEILKIVK